MTRLAEVPWVALRASIRLGRAWRSPRTFVSSARRHPPGRLARRRAGVECPRTPRSSRACAGWSRARDRGRLNLTGRSWSGRTSPACSRIASGSSRTASATRASPPRTSPGRSSSRACRAAYACCCTGCWPRIRPTACRRPGRCSTRRPPRSAPRTIAIRGSPRSTASCWWFQRLSPSFQVIHDVGARMPEECVIIIAHSLVGSQFTSMYNVPTYSRWCDTQDARPRYELHRRFLQHLQHHCRGERWVLKAPVHLPPHLGALLSVYPDARVIMTHREPLEVLESQCSLHASLRLTFTDTVDRRRLGREVTEGMVDQIRRGPRGARYRRRRSLEQFLDLVYADFAHDPMRARAQDLHPVRNGTHAGRRDAHATVPGGDAQGEVWPAPLHVGPVRARPGGGAAPALPPVPRAVPRDEPTRGVSRMPAGPERQRVIREPAARRLGRRAGGDAAGRTVLPRAQVVQELHALTQAPAHDHRTLHHLPADLRDLARPEEERAVEPLLHLEISWCERCGYCSDVTWKPCWASSPPASSRSHPSRFAWSYR